jgi:hypothetical protein
VRGQPTARLLPRWAAEARARAESEAKDAADAKKRWEDAKERARVAAAADAQAAAAKAAAEAQAAPKVKPKLTWADAIREHGNGNIERGYRKLAKRFHPDLGGTTAQMVALNLAMETLRMAAQP